LQPSSDNKWQYNKDSHSFLLSHIFSYFYGWRSLWAISSSSTAKLYHTFQDMVFETLISLTLKLRARTIIFPMFSFCHTWYIIEFLCHMKLPIFCLFLLVDCKMFKDKDCFFSGCVPCADHILPEDSSLVVYALQMLVC
jgi:hypothetical protein